jgi:predicted GNAT family N-acyltransferase
LKPELKRVAVEQILSLRHKVLRLGRPFSTASFDGDKLDSTFHFAALYNAEVIGCLSLIKKATTNLSEKNTYQLRGMAVDAVFREKKIGQQLLQYAETQLTQKKVYLIWCNVRTSANMFYLKNGYEQIGEMFDIPNVGPHVLMFKKLGHA